MPVSDFFRHIALQKRYSPRTVAIYSNAVEHLCKYLNLKDYDTPYFINNLTTNNLRGYIAESLESGEKPRTINLHLSALSSLCRYLVKSGEIKENPVQRIVRPKEERRLPDFYREESLAAYFEQPLGDELSAIRNRTMILMLYCTGIRRAELAGLMDSDIDLSRGTITVIGKGAKRRDIPIIPLLSEYILLYLQKRKSSFTDCGGHLFVTDKGEPLYLPFVNIVVKRELGELKEFSGKLSPHMLRHSFATHLLNRGAELNSIKEALGHSSLAATQVYTHNSFEKLNKVYRESHPLANRDLTAPGEHKK